MTCLNCMVEFATVEELRRHRTEVHRLAGPKKKRGGGPKLKHSTYEIIALLKTTNLPFRSIAERVGVHVRKVYDVNRRHVGKKFPPEFKVEACKVGSLNKWQERRGK